MASSAFVDVYAVPLWSRSDSSSFEITATSIFLPSAPKKTGWDVFAEISLSSMSLGRVDGVSGLAATRVSGWWEMNSPGSLVPHDTPADPAVNHWSASHCTAVHFRLGTVAAEAYARANVWVHADTTLALGDMINTHVKTNELLIAVGRRRERALLYVTRLVAFGGAELPDPRSVRRDAVAQASKLFQEEPGNLMVVAATERAPKGAFRVDWARKRIVAERQRAWAI